MKVAILFLVGLLASLIVWLNTGNEGSEKPKVIQDIYDEFLSEAQKRGIRIPQRDHKWIFKFGKLNDLQAGKCIPKTFPKEIVLDSIKWRRLDKEQRRALLFHEFGHCFLGRDHRNDKFPTGECISLMDGSESAFLCSNNFYSAKWWSYYLDELFDQTVPLPKWYEISEISDLRLTNKRIRNDTCIRSSKGLQMCWITEEIQFDRSILIELNLDTVLWNKNQSTFLTINDITLSVDPGLDVLTVRRKATSMIMLDSHYFRLESIRSSYPSLNRLSVLIKFDWVYFFLDDIQVHMMDVENQKVIAVRSSSHPSRVGNLAVYDVE